MSVSLLSSSVYASEELFADGADLDIADEDDASSDVDITEEDIEDGSEELSLIHIYYAEIITKLNEMRIYMENNLDAKSFYQPDPIIRKGFEDEMINACLLYTSPYIGTGKIRPFCRTNIHIVLDYS